MHTFTSALALVGVDVPAHLEADADVPILSAPQAQGDVLIFPASPPADATWETLTGDGVPVVHGEASGHTHWLHPGFDSPGIRWAAAADSDELTLGHLTVPEGQSALLIHTEEHGANGVGPGTYALHRKREFALPAPADTGTPDTDTQATRPSTWWQVVLD